MKKLLSIILTISMISVSSIFMVGCGSASGSGGLFSKGFDIDDITYEVVAEDGKAGLKFTNNTGCDILNINFTFSEKDGVKFNDLKKYSSLKKAEFDTGSEEERLEASTELYTAAGDSNVCKEIHLYNGSDAVSLENICLGSNEGAAMDLFEVSKIECQVLYNDSLYYINWDSEEDTEKEISFDSLEGETAYDSPSEEYNWLEDFPMPNFKVLMRDESAEPEYTAYGVDKDSYNAYIKECQKAGYKVADITKGFSSFKKNPGDYEPAMDNYLGLKYHKDGYFSAKSFNLPKDEISAVVCYDADKMQMLILYLEPYSGN